MEDLGGRKIRMKPNLPSLGGGEPRERWKGLWE